MPKSERTNTAAVSIICYEYMCLKYNEFDVKLQKLCDESIDIKHVWKDDKESGFIPKIFA